MRYASKTRCAHARKLAMWALMASVTLLVMASGCARQEVEAVATNRDIVAYLPLDGEIAAPPASQADILPLYDAPVSRIYATVGQSVQEGDVIAELAAPQTQAYYEEARQRLLRAREQLAQAERTYGAEVQAARRELEQARQAERTARQAAQDRPGVVTGQVQIIEVPDIELARAIERRREAEQAVLDAEARREANLAPYRQRLVAAEQEFQDAQRGRRAAMVRTPISGTVLEINVSAGEQVRQNQTIARVVDLGALKVYAPIQEEHLEVVDPGDEAVVTVDQVPGEEFEGSVQQIYSEQAGFLRGARYVVAVDFQNRRGLAKPDMSARASIKLGEANDVLAVPASAVYRRNGRDTVQRRVGEEWRERTVETGLSDGEYTEIRSGLEEGDIVRANP